MVRFDSSARRQGWNVNMYVPVCVWLNFATVTCSTRPRSTFKTWSPRKHATPDARRVWSASHLLTFCPSSVTSLTPCSDRLTTSDTIPSSVRDLSRPRVKGTTQNEHILLQPRMMDSHALRPCRREAETTTSHYPRCDQVKFASTCWIDYLPRACVCGNWPRR